MDNLARKHKFVQRKSKLSALNFLSMLMFSNQPLSKISLEDLANDFYEQCGAVISKQAIQERFNDYAVAFMQALLKEQLSKQLCLLRDKPMSKIFNRVRIKDSTRYTLPRDYAALYKGHGGSASPAQISIQYEYDMITGKALRLELTSACRNDQQDAKETLDDIEKDDLLIRDQAYATQTYIKHITDHGAYYLNRLNPRWTMYDRQRNPLNLAAIQKKLKRYSLPLIDMDIFIRVGKELLPSRLIACRVDAKTYQKRMHKVQKNASLRGYQVKDAYKVSASLNLFITNIDRQRLAAEQVRDTYGLRWQIELIFKVWKSQGNIHRIKPSKIQRFQCELMSRLLWILIHWQAWRLIQYHMLGKCSVWKFFKVAYRLSTQLRNALGKQKSIKLWFYKLIHQAQKKYKTEIKTGKNDNLKVLNTLLA